MKIRQPQFAPPSRGSSAASRRPLLLAPEQFGSLRDLLADFSGVYLDSARQRVLEHGLAQRLRTTGDDLPSYERRLRTDSGRDELHQLAELVLNHETFFFRNLPHMRALREALLPEIHRRKPAGAPIRIWSAGCATGEEAYSLAMIALEALGHPLPRPVEIWATDLSHAALRKARAGIYHGRAIGNLPPGLLARYLHRQGDTYTVAEAVRELVRFEFLNLLDPFPSNARDLDIIFCQNVTIYFQLETCRKLIERFYDCLPRDGLLFLGFSETLWNVFDRLRSREVAGAYVYYKESEKLSPPAGTRKQPTRTSDSAARSDGRTLGTRPLVAPTAKEEPKTAPRVSRYGQRSFHDQAPSNPAHARADEEAMRRGRELLELGQAAEALEALSHVSPQSTHAHQALTLTARAHADRGDLDLAVAEIHRALELNTLNEEAYFLLGMIYSRQEQWQPAAQQFERARYLRPDSALVSFYLAEAYRHLGRLNLAEREYRNTLQKLDGHPPGALLDGVAIGWLRETCRRQLEYLPHAP
ncbi:MAG: CheR family methyltransferase [Roseiflexaceae bacterium]